MALINETRSIEWHETCKCTCRLHEIICNNNQRWNEDKCRCECKKLIDKGVSDKGYIFNPSNCECECDKSCNISQDLDYSDCKYKKKLIDPVIEGCTESDDKTKLVNITVENDDETKIVNITVENKTSSYKVYIVLMTVVFTIFTGVTIYLVHYNWSFIKNKVFCIKSNAYKEKII